MTNKSTPFYAKVLLFGEYGIMEDSVGLSIPLSTFEGKLLQSNAQTTEQKESNASLNRFCKYLRGLEQSKQDFIDLDFEAFQEAINQGLYFDSTIPMGSGVGSSGALVAAIYYTFSHQAEVPSEIDSDGFVKLKQRLALMESYFHGQSSGLDPLSCYLNEPLLIQPGSQVTKVGRGDNPSTGHGAVFLVDSGVVGETKDMVSFFKKMKKDAHFRHKLKREFLKYNEICIDHFLSGNYKALLYDIKFLSLWAFDHFKPMIPKSMESLWKEGLESNKYFLKLCGSGGGGFFLGFSEDFESIKDNFSSHRVQVIQRF